MSLPLYSYEIENIGHQRQQEFIRDAEQFRLLRALPTPRTNFVRQTMNRLGHQFADGMRALTRQPQRMQGAR